jgi:hypothetical protein
MSKSGGWTTMLVGPAGSLGSGLDRCCTGPLHGRETARAKWNNFIVVARFGATRRLAR